MKRKNKFKINFPVKSKNGYYYLDFYFPDFNLDLEIDGQQHKKPEYVIADQIRNDFLKEKGYKVLRLEWREITSSAGKAFIIEQKQKLLQFLLELTNYS